MDTENMRRDLEQRLGRLDVAWSAMNGADARSAATIATLADWWADALAGLGTIDRQGKYLVPVDGAAYQVLHYLIPEAEAASSGFWGTDLGRAIARYGYAPVNKAGQVPSAVVGAILGFTRSRAHELQQLGRLLTRKQVADEMARRELEASSG